MSETPEEARATAVQRRGAHRLRAVLEAGYEDAGQQVFLRTRDVSASGVYLFAAEPPAVGQKARLLLELPGVAAILRLRGTVTRRVLGAPSGFALRFDHAANDAALVAIQRYVEGARPDLESGAPRISLG